MKRGGKEESLRGGEVEEGRWGAPLHKSSNPFPIGRIRLRPKINFQKFFIKVQEVRTENKESKRNFISRVEKYYKAYLRR